MTPEWDEENEEYVLVPETEEKVEEPKDLPEKGLSFVRVGNMWSIVELKFNIDTKQAEVVNITPLHTNKVIAKDKFRVKFFKEI